MKRREKRDAKEEIKEKCENNFINRKFIISKKNVGRQEEN